MVQVFLFLGLLVGLVAGTPAVRAATCGDGIVDVSEGCDDGNLVDGDCCSSSCEAEQCEAEPYERLSEDEVELFEEGSEEFAEEDTPEGGLGPVFNGASCAECHNVPTVGGSSPRVETRFGRYVGMTFDPMPSYGGSLRQENGITGTCSVPGEVVPPEATVSSLRQTTPLFGLGLVDGVAEKRILRRADPDDRNGDGISGRPNMIGGRVGRFGWKAQVVSLHDFSGDAYLNEMGITNPDFPTENNPQGGPVVCDDVPDPEDPFGSAVGAFTDFMTMLAPLPTGERTTEVRKGHRLFRRIRCKSCHLERMRSARRPVRAVSLRRVRLFSDLLLHDMGAALADGIEQGVATGSEFRTAPLWGARASAPYMHDGRAPTLQDAIAAHGGEAQAARDKFFALTVTERSWVIAFLNTL